jgi:AcrR family transcriptional regulator
MHPVPHVPETAVIAPDDGSHLATRYRLMDAAARLMAHQGYVGTSVRAIASRAGLTTGAIYAQFPGGKEELFLAILASVGREVQRFVGEALVAATDPVDLIVRQAGALWDFFDTYPSFAALVVRESISGALGDPSPFVEQNADAILQLRALFEQAIAAGLMAPVSCSYVMFWVTTTCTTFHGCRPLRETVWTDDHLARARADFLDSLRRMLTPPPPGAPA